MERFKICLRIGVRIHYDLTLFQSFCILEGRERGKHVAELFLHHVSRFGIWLCGIFAAFKRDSRGFLALFCSNVQRWLSGTVCSVPLVAMLTSCLTRFSVCAVLRIFTVVVVWLVGATQWPRLRFLPLLPSDLSSSLVRNFLIQSLNHSSQVSCNNPECPKMCPGHWGLTLTWWYASSLAWLDPKCCWACHQEIHDMAQVVFLLRLGNAESICLVPSVDHPTHVLLGCH